MSTNMDLKEWFALLKRMRDDRSKACESLEDQIRLLQEELDAKSRPFDDQITTIESEIKVLAVNRGESFKCNYSAVSFRKGYMKITYSSKALETLTKKDEALKDLLWRYRTATPVAPSTTIEVY
jgi:hypothetical protein